MLGGNNKLHINRRVLGAVFHLRGRTFYACVISLRVWKFMIFILILYYLFGKLGLLGFGVDLHKHFNLAEIFRIICGLIKC